MVSEALPKCRLNRPVRVTGWPPPIRAKAPSSIPLSSTAVLRAVEELGYKPNRAARSLVSQRTFTVGAVLSDLRNTWYIDLLESVRIELTAHGLNLFLAEDQQIESQLAIKTFLLVGRPQ